MGQPRNHRIRFPFFLYKNMNLVWTQMPLILLTPDSLIRYAPQIRGIHVYLVFINFK